MSLLQMSFSGAVMILAVIVIRALSINKLPKKTFLVLWDIILLRLLIPFSLPSIFSIYSLIGRNTHAMNIASNTQTANLIPIVPSEQETVLPNTSIPQAVSVYGVIWAIGVLLCAVFFVMVYWKCRQEFQISFPVSNDYTDNWLSTHKLKRIISIRQSSRISAPLTYGVFHPVILMPKTIEWSNTNSLQYVLEHEYVHIKRFDTITKFVLIIAFCVHWFNPLVWAMYILANRDIELSCDEAVVRIFGESKKSAYARTLISMEETRSGLTPLCNNFSKNAIEERITAIMKIKKTTMLSLVLAVLVVAGTTTAFATSAHATTNRKNVESTTLGEIMLSQTDKDGNIQYSMDEGKTFFSEEEFNKQYPSVDVEWWTYEEYKAWLENEKKVLQSMLGEQAYTEGRGEFVWTQEIIDETIAMYEANLQDIKNGMQLSKLVAGSDEIALAQYDDKDAIFGKAEGVSIVFDNGETAIFGPYDTTEELVAEVKPYCEQQVQLGNMTQSEADEIISKYTNR